MRCVRLMADRLSNEMWDEMAIVRLEEGHMLGDDMKGDTRSGPHVGHLSSVVILPPLAKLFPSRLCTGVNSTVLFFKVFSNTLRCT